VKSGFEEPGGRAVGAGEETRARAGGDTAAKAGTADGAPNGTPASGPAGATLTEGPGGAETAAPCGRFGRFELRELLGEGGMGRVFRAFDPELCREVALKVLRSEDRRGRERLLREARAQARLDVSGICRIYETGELDDHPYITMQLVRGRPLHQAMAEMSLEERVKALAETAEALHEAHRLGLIHRDVKPANILLDRDGDGRWRTHLCDFGVVRDTGRVGLTESEAMLGTPGYIAPEQLRRDRSGLDRRTDVYGLGATLYQVLTGQPPFAGIPLPELFRRLDSEDPPPPRRLNRTVPPDLEAVALKCMEREPARRYDSAREVAEELRRWLDGRPVTARCLTPLGRLGKLARRRRWAVLAATAVALLVLGSLLYTWSIRVRAQREQELQARFNLMLSTVAERLAMAYSRERHDIGAETAWARRKLPEIERAIRAEGDAAAGVGRYSLGRAYQLLGQEEDALAQLRLAWSSGYRHPFVAYAFGRSLGLSFQARLSESDTIADPEVRAASRREVEAAYRDEALALLRQGASLPGEIPLEAFLALAEGRHEDALKALAGDPSALRWPFEGVALRGAILAAQADSLREQGRLEDSATTVRLADQALREALALAPSYPEGHRLLCRLRRGALALEAARGGDTNAALTTAEAAVAAYLEVAPGAPAPWLERARNGLVQAQHQFDLYLYPEMETTLRRVLADTDQAVRRGPGLAEPHRLKASAYRLATFREVPVLGHSTAELVGRVEAELAAVARHEPLTAADFHAIGAAWRNQVQDLLGDRNSAAIDSETAPPMTNFQSALLKAKEALLQAYRLDATFSPTCKDMGYLYYCQGIDELAGGNDPSQSFRQSLDWTRRALALNSRYFDALDNLGQAHWSLAGWAMDNGRDPRPDFRQAEAAFKRDIQANPARVLPLDHLSETYRSWTRHEMRIGGDPRPLVLKQKILLGRPPVDNLNLKGQFGFQFARILTLLQEAEVELTLNGDGRPAWREARSRFDELWRSPGYQRLGDGNLELLRIRLGWVEIRNLIRRGLSPAAKLAELFRAYHELPLLSQRTEIVFVYLEARLIQAEWRLARAGPSFSGSRAGGTVRSDTVKMLALLEQLMSHNQCTVHAFGWSEALVLRGRFHLVLAKMAADPAAARAESARAVADFTAARRRNRFQERPTEAWLAEARRLAHLPEQIDPE